MVVFTWRLKMCVGVPRYTWTDGRLGWDVEEIVGVSKD